jgi:hypothetical protein
MAGLRYNADLIYLVLAGISLIDMAVDCSHSTGSVLVTMLLT